MSKDQQPENTSNNDFNSYNEKFPHPQLIFTHKFKSFNETRDNCLVSLDTNVLLAPYSLRKESINEIEKVYFSLQKKNRLFLCAQAAREFAANKQNKLSEIHNSIFERKIKIKPNPDYPILLDLPEYQALTKNIDEIKLNIELYNSNLDAIANKIKEWAWNDPVVDIYSRIFSKDIIFDHTLSTNELLADLARRTKLKIAPGYKDSAKDSNAEGDLSIWHTLLEVGKNQQQDIVFVSEDRKPDWWARSGGQAFTPRSELIHEFQNKTGGKNIHLLIFSEFLKAFDVSQDVVNEVKNEELLRLQKPISSKVKLYTRTPRSLLIAALASRGIDTSVCTLCGFQANPESSILELHHLTSIKDGGSDSVDNVILVCPNCHREVHKKT
jgi:hypothetical protein